ncbi:hypothetical protein [Streptomyces iconiensis]|uniref:DUF3558 domain-containing protein n=1 Tax=Streptomyces iconiensis TaxID=1384038 RepID=A0ABT6ZXP1_9ACTN|nr:hypothetical protein [Streptomyces iconiensis]MDJ1133833.1 hypothetical protein [Streptomyces iconiensis]
MLALVLAGALTACTDSSGADDEGDTKPGGASTSASAAPPGKYRTLPEPCGTVNINTLKDMLPGAAASEDAESDPDSPTADASPSPFEGEASETYDTDRRSGCRWKNATTLSTRHLNVDFERVVSYDPAVSDDQQAERLYDRKASKAEIPVSSASPDNDGGDGEGDQTQEDQSGDGKGSKKGSPDGGASPSGDSPSAKGSSAPKDPKDSEGPKDSEDSTDSQEPAQGGSSSPGTDEDLAPRTLDDIGDTAYINDKLDTGDSGLHRDITLVFRTANVIATVEYDQWVTDKHRIPDSRELQDKARKLAEQLAAHFEEE